jgi:hypothetical protein
VVIGIVVVLTSVLNRDKSTAGGSSRGGERPPTSQGPEGTEPSKTAPQSGSLRERVPQRVGEFTLVSVKPVEVPGATDSVIALYRSGSQELAHGLVVFGSDSAAQAHQEQVAAKSTKDSGVTGRPIRIRDKQEQVIGEGTFFDASPEIFSYHVGKISGLIHGPRGKVKPYFSDAPM